MRALRESGAAGARTAAALLTSNDAKAAKTIVLRDLNPVIRRNGEVYYRLSDGGAVTDEKHCISIDKTSYQATLFALTLGAQRFAGRSLALEGSEALKRQAVEIASALKLGVTFSDSAMEEERQRLIMNNAARLPSAVLATFVDGQNKLAHTLSSGYVYRLWTSGDAGEVIYCGRRTLTDGSEALLFRRGTEMLIKAASGEEAQKAEVWQHGAKICFDRSGRIARRVRQ